MDIAQLPIQAAMCPIMERRPHVHRPIPITAMATLGTRKTTAMGPVVAQTVARPIVRHPVRPAESIHAVKPAAVVYTQTRTPPCYVRVSTASTAATRKTIRTATALVVVHMVVVGQTVAANVA